MLDATPPAQALYMVQYFMLSPWTGQSPGWRLHIPTTCPRVSVSDASGIKPARTCYSHAHYPRTQAQKVQYSTQYTYRLLQYCCLADISRPSMALALSTNRSVLGQHSQTPPQGATRLPVAACISLAQWAQVAQLDCNRTVPAGRHCQSHRWLRMRSVHHVFKEMEYLVHTTLWCD
jgi:hypothetical protein